MANGRITLGKQSGGTLGLVFPDGVSNTEVVLPESGELVTKAYADLKVALESFVGTNQSLMPNGYQKMPGGLIIQWGEIAGNGTGTYTATLPIAFPSSILVAVDSWSNGTATTVAIRLTALSTTSVSFESRNTSSGVLQSVAYVRYIAIGY